MAKASHYQVYIAPGLSRGLKLRKGELALAFNIL